MALGTLGHEADGQTGHGLTLDHGAHLARPFNVFDQELTFDDQPPPVGLCDLFPHADHLGLIVRKEHRQSFGRRNRALFDYIAHPVSGAERPRNTGDFTCV